MIVPTAEQYDDMRTEIVTRALARTAGRPPVEQSGEVLGALDAYERHLALASSPRREPARV
ncbi:hypothetical protein AB0I55_29335 [Actinocatenispora sera]|uniref:hypothetical protein n=1 Tax=Actinocatenispora sera TaxID=390989 RepID=UPI0033D4252F